jgi:hypothetical protein
MRARRTSGRDLTHSEFTELFPISNGLFEREPGESDGDFVQRYRPWDWWMTLTFKDTISETYALCILKAWSKDLALEIGSHLTLAVAIELQRRDAPHFHLLLHVHQHAADFDPDVVEERWRSMSKRCGTRNTIVPFDRKRRGGDYLTKEGVWGFLVACPRWPACRRRGCVVDPYAW